MNFLENIVGTKKKEIETTLAHISKNAVRRNAQDTRVPHDFGGTLSRRKELSVIAEIKKASPSKGIIRKHFDPVQIAGDYVANRADCLSVLTDTRYFQGKNDYVTAIKSTYDIPVLRKDFIVDERQIRESYDIGADAILLIVACLAVDRLKRFKTIALEFGLSILVEIHSREDLDKIESLNFDMIGINNRNLSTFKVSTETSLELVGRLPKHVVKISESGITTRKICVDLANAGFDAVLIGEHFMRQPSPGKALYELTHDGHD